MPSLIVCENHLVFRFEVFKGSTNHLAVSIVKNGLYWLVVVVLATLKAPSLRVTNQTKPPVSSPKCRVLKLFI